MSADSITFTSPFRWSINLVEGSREGDGKHLSVSEDGHAIKFQPEALLTPQADCLVDIACEVGEVVEFERNNKKRLQSLIASISLRYPSSTSDGQHRACSTLMPIKIVFHNAAPTPRRIPPWANQTRGECDYPIGISQPVFMALWNNINRWLSKQWGEEDWEDADEVDDRRSCFRVENRTCHDGHIWIYAKGHDTELKIRDEEAPEGMRVSERIRTTDSSLECDAVLRLYLLYYEEEQHPPRVDRRARYSAQGARTPPRRSERWKLQMTIWQLFDHARHTTYSRRARTPSEPEDDGTGELVSSLQSMHLRMSSRLNARRRALVEPL